MTPEERHAANVQALRDEYKYTLRIEAEAKQKLSDITRRKAQVHSELLRLTHGQLEFGSTI